MKKSDAKKKKDYHNRRWNFYKKKEKEAEERERQVGFKIPTT